MSTNSKLWDAVFSASVLDNVTFEHDGNFTLAILVSGNEQAVGVTKRRVDDIPSDCTGENIALWRAVQKMMKKHPKAPLSKKLRKAIGE